MAMSALDSGEPRTFRGLRAALLALWALASFGVAFFAREIDLVAWGWPLNFWLLAQGSVLVFLGIVMAYAWWMNRVERATQDLPPAATPAGPDDGR
jgi:putative solute:sodium symporter small subunit